LDAVALVAKGVEFLTELGDGGVATTKARRDLGDLVGLANELRAEGRTVEGELVVGAGVGLDVAT
jgi:hypothetical protein